MPCIARTYLVSLCSRCNKFKKLIVMLIEARHVPGDMTSNMEKSPLYATLDSKNTRLFDFAHTVYISILRISGRHNV